MRSARRGFTLIEVIIAILIGSMLCGTIAMTIKVSTQSKAQRADIIDTSVDAVETLDMIERLLQRAVEIPGGPYGGTTGRLENFQNPSPFINQNDNDAGIQFFADVDPSGPTDSADRDAARQKYLEWVWIWTDRTQAQPGSAWPYERRYPVKVAIFRALPNVVGYDQWTKPSDNLYQNVNDPNGPPKPCLTIGADFASLRFKVGSVDDTATSSHPTLKRVTITGAVFPDRDLTFPSWGQVSPGAGNYLATGYPGGRSSIPSFVVTRTIIPRNLGATRDPFRNNQFRYHSPMNRNQTRNTELSYTSNLSNPGAPGYAKGGAPYLAE